MARPPSSHPAVCSTKLTPARQVGSKVLADSKAACASGIFDAHRLPPERNGIPRRRASAAMEYSTNAGSGVPNVGAPDCIEIEEAKLPSTTGAPGLTSCTNARPAKRFGEGLRDGAGDGDRRHRAGQNEGSDDQCLVGARIHLGGAEHGRIVGHRRIDVDQIDDGRLRTAGQRIGQLVAEHDIRQGDGIRGPLGSRHRTHEGLVAVFQMAVHHVEMPLVDRQIDRLANRAARMVQGVGDVGELDEIAEILDSRVAAAFVEIAHERRAIGRSEYRVLAADDHAARRIARVLREFARRGALYERTAHAAGEMHPLALDVGAGGLPDFERLGIVAKIDADLLENGVGVVLHQREAFLVQDLVVRESCG